jgi:hypothetical protein
LQKAAAFCPEFVVFEKRTVNNSELAVTFPSLAEGKPEFFL